METNTIITVSCTQELKIQYLHLHSGQTLE